MGGAHRLLESHLHGEVENQCAMKGEGTRHEHHPIFGRGVWQGDQMRDPPARKGDQDPVKNTWQTGFLYP